MLDNILHMDISHVLLQFFFISHGIFSLFAMSHFGLLIGWHCEAFPRVLIEFLQVGYFTSLS